MNLGLLVRIEAKPEYAEKVAGLLSDALRLAREEEHTVTWFAFRESPTVFGVFDTFETEEARAAHLQGRIAAALMEAAETMLSSAPDIRPVDLLAVKL
ncbi:putative quinol monooxygenase [Streptomyces sp. NPDC020681]|uniref:putative quinol monooxygenase n=1 Tax=Streptomyces sp. NPDC020681 TaxID=3365083 RepID=UPI00379C0011